MSQRRKLRNGAKSTSQGSSLRGWKLALGVIAGLAIVGSVGSIVWPLVFPVRQAKIEISGDESCLKDKFEATRKHLVILQKLPDAAAAKAAVPALREAMELEITAHEALAKYLVENPPTELQTQVLRPRMNVQLQSLDAARGAIISAQITMPEDLERAIR